MMRTNPAIGDGLPLRQYVILEALIPENSIVGVVMTDFDSVSAGVPLETCFRSHRLFPC